MGCLIMMGDADSAGGVYTAPKLQMRTMFESMPAPLLTWKKAIGEILWRGMGG